MTQLSLSRALALLTIAAAGSPAATAPTSIALDRFLQRGDASCSQTEQRMEVEIEASLPKLEKHGAMKGLKVVSRSGQVAYQFLRFTGDKLIKNDVIVRFLTADARPPEGAKDSGITAKNYKFRFLRTAGYRGSAAYVYQLKPRKKRVGLYKGELWLDASSSTILRESGALVKSPSIFIRRVQFVRDYSDQASPLSSCGQPERMSISVETRIVGNADMIVVQRPALEPENETEVSGDAGGGLLSSPN